MVGVSFFQIYKYIFTNFGENAKRDQYILLCFATRLTYHELAQLRFELCITGRTAYLFTSGIIDLTIIIVNRTILGIFQPFRQMRGWIIFHHATLPNVLVLYLRANCKSLLLHCSWNCTRQNRIAYRPDHMVVASVAGPY